MGGPTRPPHRADQRRDRCRAAHQGRADPRRGWV